MDFKQFQQVVKTLSTEELKERIINYDLWQSEFIEAAKQEVLNRKEWDEGIDDAVFERSVVLKAIEKQGKQVSPVVIGLAYLLAFFFMIGFTKWSLFAIIIMTIICLGRYFGEITDSDGQKMKKYRKKDLNTFKYLFGFSLAVFVIRLILYKNF